MYEACHKTQTSLMKNFSQEKQTLFHVKRSQAHFLAKNNAGRGSAGLLLLPVVSWGARKMSCVGWEGSTGDILSSWQRKWWMER